MALSNYIALLKETRTYKSGLIELQEYSIETKLWGLQRKLPKVPHADYNRHVIVMEVIGEQPNLYTILTDPKHFLDLTTKHADNLLFIFVEMRPRGLTVRMPESGYQLGDGHTIQMNMGVSYKIIDVEAFWRGSRDPIENLEGSIINSSKNFFLGKFSNDLISSPGVLKQSLEQHVENSAGIIGVKNDLEKNVKNVHGVPGLQVMGVTADIKLSDSLQQHLNRLHERIFTPGGVLDRQKIDQLIDKDTTYSPYSLRDVVRRIDMRLLENFYIKSWPEAMQLVAEKVTELKTEYQAAELEQDKKELARYKTLLNEASEMGLEEEDKLDLKAKVAEKMHKLLENETSAKPMTDTQFIDSIVGSSVNTKRLISDDTGKQTT